MKDVDEEYEKASSWVMGAPDTSSEAVMTFQVRLHDDALRCKCGTTGATPPAASPNALEMLKTMSKAVPLVWAPMDSGGDVVQCVP